MTFSLITNKILLLKSQRFLARDHRVAASVYENSSGPSILNLSNVDVFIRFWRSVFTQFMVMKHLSFPCLIESTNPVFLGGSCLSACFLRRWFDLRVVRFTLPWWILGRFQTWTYTAWRSWTCSWCRAEKSINVILHLHGISCGISACTVKRDREV